MMTHKTSRIQHDSSKKNRLIGALLAGKGLCKAARMTNLQKSTAADIWKRYQQTGSTKNQPHSGCPKVVTDRLKRQIINAAKKVDESRSRRSRTTSSPKSATQPSGMYWPRKDTIDALHARCLTSQKSRRLNGFIGRTYTRITR